MSKDYCYIVLNIDGTPCVFTAKMDKGNAYVYGKSLSYIESPPKERVFTDLETAMRWANDHMGGNCSDKSIPPDCISDFEHSMYLGVDLITMKLTSVKDFKLVCEFAESLGVEPLSVRNRTEITDLLEDNGVVYLYITSKPNRSVDSETNHLGFTSSIRSDYAAQECTSLSCFKRRMIHIANKYCRQ